jgi:hypothetical protein
VVEGVVRGEAVVEVCGVVLGSDISTMHGTDQT